MEARLFFSPSRVEANCKAAKSEDDGDESNFLVFGFHDGQPPNFCLDEDNSSCCCCCCLPGEHRVLCALYTLFRLES